MLSRTDNSKFGRFVLCAAALLLTAVSSVRAQIVNLPAPGADCVANGNALRNAIDGLIAAGTGGTINVPQGVYCFDRPWRLDGLTNEAFTGTRTIAGVPITINGVQAAGSSTPATPTNLVIRRQAALDLPVGVSANFRLFNVESGGGLTINNATLCNGRAGQGGALRAVGGNQISLNNCIVQDNNSFTRGGGLFIQNVGAVGDPTALGLDLTDVKFYRNVSENGFGGGGSVEGTNTQLRGCIFSCNQALGGDDADGGGLYFNNGGDPGVQTKFFALLASTTQRSLFTCNSSNSEGGGLFINGGTSDPDGGGPANPLPSEVDFFGNRAGFQGGGLYTQATSVEFNGCTFGGLSPTLTCLGSTPGAASCANNPGTCMAIGEANQAPRGGGVMNVTSQAIFRRCKFVGNRAILPGANGQPGGGRAGGAGSSGGTNAYIECCFINNIAAEDFAGNTPGNSRGGGSDAEFGSPMYNDCLFKGNEAANGGGISISGQGKDTTTLIYNCQITQNVGSVAGGGIAVLGDAGPRILHSTIARNRASRPGVAPTANSTAGTGIHTGGPLSLPTVINSIVTQNQRGTGVVNGSFSGVATVRASFSFIDVGTNAVYPDTVPGGNASPSSNIKGCWKPGTTGANFDDNDPSFESSGIDGMNVHLLCNSPCIDHANYVLARSSVRFLINLGSVSPIPEARGQRGEVQPIDISDSAAVDAFITAFLKDYDDTALTSGNDENCTGLGTGQDRPNTCRPLQCQSDMGADEARTDIVMTPFANKVVCLGRSQSFTATGNCAPPGSPAIPLIFQWCRVDPVTCVETVLNGVAGYTVTTTPDGTSSTLTIAAAVAADNAIFRVKVRRGQYLCNGANIFLPTVPLVGFLPCDGSTCPVASCQARLFVVDPPTAATTGDKSVCRNGSQCIEFNFSWPVLPSSNPLSCLIYPPSDPNAPCNGSTAVPPACTPTISYTYQATPSGQAVPFTGNARAAITCDPDVTVGNRVTRNCRITFTNPQDCDSGRYCATINCNLPDNKCLPATACANLCVTPPPTAGGDTTQTVCVTGNQTINLFADFTSPLTCATPWCPTPACIRSVQIVKRVAGQPDVTLPIGQTGRVAVTCSPINTGTRVNCTVTITGAQPADCGQYCIVAGCSNLGLGPCGGANLDKCGEATWCANLCVLDPLVGSGDPTKTVCRGGTQTIALSMLFPVGNCVFCTPTSCTPAVVVLRKRTSDGNFLPLSQTSPTNDTISGQGTAATTVTCQPFNPVTRRIDCVVTITNANDANCAEYRITGNCSNLTAADKCTGAFTTSLCVARAPTAAAPVPEKTVCIGGAQTIDLSATFPLSTCTFCSPTSCTPRFTIIKRPISGPDVTLPIGTPAGNVTVTCDPFNTTTRTQNCRVSIVNAALVDCGRYCIRAECEGLPEGKCPAAEACTALCVVPTPVTTADPDKTVCIGNSQILNFKATFPRGLCAVTTGCPTACTPSAAMVKRLPNGTEQPLLSGGNVAVACDPTPIVLPNGDREINCRVTVNNASEADCANYCIRASCGNLTGTNKCATVESCTKLCIVPNPNLTIDPTKTVCIGGRQTFNFTVNFPAVNCTAFCPTTPCTGSFQVVRRSSCTASGGDDIPINPTGTPPRVFVTCDPFNTTTRTYNCRLTVNEATAADCAAYVVRAASCPDLVAAGKCGFREVCTTLCVVPPPTSSGDPAQRVCVGGNQTFNFQAFFPNPTCTFCPTSPAACTPKVTLVRKFPGGTEQVLFDPTNPPAPTPRVTVTCNPPANVTGGRQVNCVLTLTGAQPSDCAEYCIRSTCGNLADGKCGQSEYCAALCVLPPPAPGGDQGKFVCYRGNQTINLHAEFPLGDCVYCSPESCTPNVVIKRRATNGTEVTLSIGSSRNDTAGGIVSTTSVTCSVPTGPNRRIDCMVNIANANDATCGSYCIQASCSNLATGKCATREYCSTLCILPAPTAAAETSSACVCLGGCQELRFTARFPLPSCNVAACNADACQRSITIYKLVGGVPVPLTQGPGNGQYTCDPINAQRDVVCRVRIGRNAQGQCEGADEDDAGRYCMDVTCGGLTEGKCATATACTDLSVYQRPCPSEIPDYKVCVGGELCIPFTFTAPDCCQAAITIRKNGQPVTLGAPDSPTAKYRITGSGTTRQLCIRNLENADDGNYEVCVSCTNLASEKGCSCCEPFCLDVLTPPEVAVDLRTRSVCVGQPVEFNFCFGSDAMLCPPGSTTGDPTCLNFNTPGGPMRVPVRYRIEKLTDPMATLPPTDANCTLGPAASVPFTLTQVPGVTNCEFRYRLSIPALRPEQCGIYRLSVEYCGINPVGLCTDCVYFEIKCGSVNVCLQGRRECPGVPLFLCPRLPDYANCDPDPYVIQPYTYPYDYAQESALICNSPRLRCLTFQWYRQREGEPGFTPIPLSENPTAQSCCLDLGITDPSDVACYKVRVSTRTDGDCSDQPPCDPVDSPSACVTIKPPEECCWCVDCCWDNGRRDTINGNGVLSMKPVHGEFPEIKAAADFFLCGEQFYQIKKFAGSMLIRQNTALPYKAKLTLYEDCDGCPGEMIDMWDLTEYCVVGEADATGLQGVDFTYDFTTEKLWLRGNRTYWWSLQGTSEINTPNYEAYWVTSEAPAIMGSVPKKMEVGVDMGWDPLDACCIDCVELAFCIECDSCKIIYDGGEPEPCATAGGTRSEKSVSAARNSRAADQFVTPPYIKAAPGSTDECDYIPVDWMVCYIEGYIYTNCNAESFIAWLEIYGNDCDDPNWSLVGAPGYRFRADKIEELDCVATIDGVPNLRLYKVRFCPIGTDAYPLGLYLRGGRNYWLSLSVEDTFNQNQRAYFAWKSDNCDQCDVQFNPGQQIAPGRNIVRWSEIGRDFAFVIAAKNVPFDINVPAPVIDPAPQCAADANRDGALTVQDLFDFLSAWFAGCP